MKSHLARCVVFAVAVLGISGVRMVAAQSRQSTKPQALTIVLDCSDLMGRGFADSDSQDDSKRFAAIKESLELCLSQLAREGNHQVSFWLYGHRIAWGEGEEPGLIEQEKYLNDYFSPNAATGLEPGKDVERVLPLAPFDDSQLREISGRLKAVEPWGESPLYLALSQAVYTHGRDSRVVVLTAGKNVQWMVQSKQTKIDALKPAIEQETPIDVVFFHTDVEDRELAESELLDIAERTGGRFFDVAETGEISDRMEEALLQRVKKQKTNQSDGLKFVSDEVTPEVIAHLIKTIQAASASELEDATNRVTGIVTYYGTPVAKATVEIEGASVSAVKTDELGGFTFQGVPAGDYTLVVEGISKNQYHRARVPVKVSSKAGQTARAKISLE